MKILIVEDELLAQEELIRLLKKNFSGVEIIGTLVSVEESVAWFAAGNTADVVFMDIHLSDGSCFDILDRVKVDIPIIYTTAYDEYAIEAFRTSGVGYLLKPVSESELVSSVNKLNTLLNLRNKSNDTVRYKSRVMARIGDSIVFTDINDVAYFYSEDGVTFMVSRSGKRHIIEHTLESLECKLDPSCFFRLSRGCISSVWAISSVSRYFNSRLKVCLTPGNDFCIIISRVRVNAFLEWLDR